MVYGNLNFCRQLLTHARAQMNLDKYRSNWPLWGASDQKQAEVLGAILMPSNQLTTAEDGRTADAATGSKPVNKSDDHQSNSNQSNDAKTTPPSKDGEHGRHQKDGEGQGSTSSDTAVEDQPKAVMVQFKHGAAAHYLEDAAARFGDGTYKMIRAQDDADGSGPLIRFKLSPGQEINSVLDQLNQHKEISYSEEDFFVTKDKSDLNTLHHSVENSLNLTETAPEAAADDFWVTVDYTSNDTQFTNNSLWGLNGRYGINADDVWATGEIGNTKTIVGVIDTGVDYTHQDLYLNIWLNQHEVPTSIRNNLTDIDGDGLFTFRDLNDASNAAYVFDFNDNGYIDAGDLLDDLSGWENGTDDDGNGYTDDLIGWDFYNNDNDPIDTEGHGTHVSGTIGAMGGNNLGVVGVNWNVQIVALQFLGPDRGYTSDAVLAVDYFTDAAKAASGGENFVATNNSWGGGGYSTTLNNAIGRAAAQDILFIAAAGNDGTNNDTAPHYPSNYTSNFVVSVASITSSGSLSSFSNYGVTSVDIGAPGSGIVSTVPGDGYASYNGTSMATPQVTGAVALYASVNPDATAAEIRSALFDSAVATSSLSGRTATGGRLDVAGMMDVTVTPPPPPPPDIAGDTSTSATLTTAQSETSTVDFGGDQDWFAVTLTAGVSYQFNLKAAPGSYVDPYLVLMNEAGAVITENDDIDYGVNLNSQINYTATNSGLHYISAQAYGDTTGSYELSVSASRGNIAPIANDDTASTSEDTAIASIDVLGNDQDGDGDLLSVTGTPSALNGTVTINGDGTLRYAPEANFFGTDTIIYTVSDGYGGSDTGSVSVMVSPVNDAPVAANDTASTIMGVGLDIDVLGNDVDVDGDRLSVTGTPSALNGTVTINGDGTLRYTPNADFTGDDVITYTVQDILGASDAATVTITVAPPTPAARSDQMMAWEDETAGDADGNVLANDGTSTVSAVAGSASNVGQNVAGSNGGQFTINSDGSLDFSAAGDFENLRAGATATTSVTYTTIIEGAGGPSSAAVDPTQGVEIAIKDFDPAGVLPSSGSFTASAAMSGTLSDGTITITDVQDTTFSDDNNGNERATSSGSVGGRTWTNITTDNEIQWVIRDTVTGDQITVFQVQVEGSINQYYWGATAELVEGRSYQVVSRDTNPNAANGVAYADMVLAGPGIVEETTSVTVTVQGINDAPVVVGESYSTNKNQQLANLDVLANDSDVDSTSLIVTQASASHGSVVINQNGTLTYTPSTDYVGADTIVYTVSDGDGGQTQGSASVTVNRGNIAPIANDDTASTSEDTAIASIDVLGNDQDGDRDLLSVTGTPSALNGTVTINGDGTLRYAPEANFFGTDTIIYTVSDGYGGSDTGSVSVMVSPVNDAPVAANDTASTIMGVGLDIDVLGNDVDVDGDRLSVTGTPSALNGTVTINGDGTLRYTPNADFTGDDVITYTVQDILGASDAATVTITVAPPTPAARSDQMMAWEDETAGDADGNVLANDGTSTVSAVAGSASNVGQNVAGSNGGQFTINSDGSLDFSAAGDFENLRAGATATTSVTYTTIIEGAGGPSSAAVDPTQGVEIAIKDFDPAGVLPSSGSFTASAAMSGTLSDGTITITDVQDTTFSDDNNGNERATSSGSVGGRTWTNITTDNEIQWVIRDTVTGDQITVFQVQVEGSINQYYWGATAELVEGRSYQVVSRDTNPNAANGVAYADMVLAGPGIVEETTSVTVTVQGINDAPVVVGESYSTNKNQQLANLDVLANDSDVDSTSLIVTQASASHGSVVINQNGTLTYTPSTDYVGADTIVYTVSDGDGGQTQGSASVTVNRGNIAPIANDDTASTSEDTAIASIDVLGNDQDGDRDLLSVTGTPSALNGTVTINGDGTLRYAPEANFFGTDTIIYTVSDGYGGSDTGSVSVMVSPVNDAPVAANDTASTIMGVGLDIDVLGNDVDVDGDRLSVTGTPSALNGTVTINGDGTLRYTPNADFTGDDVITYTVQDILGASDAATVTITVAPPTPAARSDQMMAWEDETAGDADGNVLANDGTSTVSAVAGSASNVGQNVAGSNGGQFTINSDGSLDFSAAGDFENLRAGATATTSVTYTTIIEGAGGPSSAAVDPTQGVEIAIKDFDPAGVLPSSGSFTASAAMSGTLSDGTITITDVQDTTFSDDNNGNERATSSGSVGGRTWTNITTDNEIQWVIRDTVTGDQITVFQVQVEGSINQYYWGATAELVEGRSYQVVSRDTNPNAANGVAYADMVLAGPGIVEETTSVTVTVQGINDAPVVVGESYSTNKNQQLANLDVLANDSDVDSTSLIVTQASASHGSVVINQNGTLTYTPSTDYVGADTIVYTVSDGDGGQTQGSASVTVNRGNIAPIANDDTASTSEDTAIASIDVLGNDQDGDRDLLSVTGTPSALNGTVTINGDGTLRYAPEANFFGTDTIIYTVSDGYGGSDTGSVSVMVSPVNDAPVAANDTASTIMGVGLDIDVLGNDVDVDGDRLSVTGTPSALNGTVTINGDGTLRYTPNADFTGDDVITYTVQDILGASDAATVTVNVANDQQPIDPTQGVEIAIKDFDPAGVLPSSGSFTASAAMSGTLSDGTITITDVQDTTFSDDNNGNERATSSGSVGGRTWTNITTDNEIQWVIRDTVTGDQITVFQVQVEGSINQYYWGATAELVEGRSYQVVSRDTNPNAANGVAYADMVLAGASSSASNSVDGTVLEKANAKNIEDEYNNEIYKFSADKFLFNEIYQQAHEKFYLEHFISVPGYFDYFWNDFLESVFDEVNSPDLEFQNEVQHPRLDMISGRLEEPEECCSGNIPSFEL